LSVLSRWSAKLRIRRNLEHTAKSEHEKAQDALERARAGDLHPRAELVMARDKAAAKLKLRRAQVQEAEKVVARHSKTGAPKVNPERTRISPNRSSRNGVKPRLIVLHITVSHNRPGMADIDGILDFFSRPGTQASSHIVNDREGHDARCVHDADKAWTQAAFNPMALSIEQIEYSAGRTRDEWMKESRKQLDNSALWCAAWSKAHGIPLTFSTTNGVCEHRHLGAAGGGHSDCGVGYPLDYVLEKAREYRAQM
jgi:hypothetical protein